MRAYLLDLIESYVGVHPAGPNVQIREDALVNSIAVCVRHPRQLVRARCYHFSTVRVCCVRAHRECYNTIDGRMQIGFVVDPHALHYAHAPARDCDTTQSVDKSELCTTANPATAANGRIRDALQPLVAHQQQQRTPTIYVVTTHSMHHTCAHTRTHTPTSTQNTHSHTLVYPRAQTL